MVSTFYYYNIRGSQELVKVETWSASPRPLETDPYYSLHGNLELVKEEKKTWSASPTTVYMGVWN